MIGTAEARTGDSDDRALVRAHHGERPVAAGAGPDDRHGRPGRTDLGDPANHVQGGKVGERHRQIDVLRPRHGVAARRAGREEGADGRNGGGGEKLPAGAGHAIGHTGARRAVRP